MIFIFSVHVSGQIKKKSDDRAGQNLRCVKIAHQLDSAPRQQAILFLFLFFFREPVQPDQS
jgi:hypothetical protein